MRETNKRLHAALLDRAASWAPAQERLEALRARLEGELQQCYQDAESADSAKHSLARLVSAHSVFLSNVEAPYLPLPPPVLPRPAAHGDPWGPTTIVPAVSGGVSGAADAGWGAEGGYTGPRGHFRGGLEPDEWRMARGAAAEAAAGAAWSAMSPAAQALAQSGAATAAPAAAAAAAPAPRHAPSAQTPPSPHTSLPPQPQTPPASAHTPVPAAAVIHSPGTPEARADAAGAFPAANGSVTGAAAQSVGGGGPGGRPDDGVQRPAPAQLEGVNPGPQVKGGGEKEIKDMMR